MAQERGNDCLYIDCDEEAVATVYWPHWHSSRRYEKFKHYEGNFPYCPRHAEIKRRRWGTNPIPLVPDVESEWDE